MSIPGTKLNAAPRSKNFSGLAFVLSVICLFGAGGCSHTQVAPEDMRLTPESYAQRQAQTRVFATDNEPEVLAAVASVLQDMGFSIDETEVKLGVIVGSKERSAVRSLQVATAIVVFALTRIQYPWDISQRMRVSVVATPTEHKGGTAVRATFQRLVVDSNGAMSKAEPLGSAEIYQEFFAKLSKALFLRAQGQ